jgi:hypothetical protein
MRSHPYCVAIVAVALAALPLASGCGPGGGHAAGNSMGLVDIRDINSAKASGEALPGVLGLSPDQVEVGPEAGYSTAVISGVSSDAERERIASAVETYNAQNTRRDPVRVSFK